LIGQFVQVVERDGGMEGWRDGGREEMKFERMS